MVTSRKTRFVVHLMRGDVLLKPNLPLPTLERDELASLSQLVRDVWTAAPDWHQFPGDELVLRALPMHHSVQGDICFELKKSRHPEVVHGYLYERVRGILVVQGSHAVEDGPETDRGKPKEPLTATALRIIAACEQGPAGPDLDRRVEFHESFARRHDPKYTTISDLAHRIVDHWFAPKARGWGWRRRFPFTFAGSMTFFLFWTGYVVGSTGGFDAIEFNLVIAIFLGLSVVGSPWFAGITAWKDLSYGPVRLFLSGFLLPYFVWTLVAIMYARPIPDFVDTRAPTSDVRPAPRPAVPAPSGLVPGAAPPQSSGQPS